MRAALKISQLQALICAQMPCQIPCRQFETFKDWGRDFSPPQTLLVPWLFPLLCVLLWSWWTLLIYKKTTPSRSPLPMCGCVSMCVCVRGSRLVKLLLCRPSWYISLGGSGKKYIKGIRLTDALQSCLFINITLRIRSVGCVPTIT